MRALWCGAAIAAIAACNSTVEVIPGGPSASSSGAGGAAASSAMSSAMSSSATAGPGGSGGAPVSCAQPPGPAQRVDLLLVVDNSAFMADKQAVLAATVPSLIADLLNPPCVDANCVEVAHPANPGDQCPTGQRAWSTITDMHIGVITTSLGSHGADSCIGNTVPSENDRAHLINRGSIDGSQPPVPTWANQGFLAWDPLQNLMPPGMDKRTELESALAKIVVGAGEAGCGFESQEESWYRFLVDPDPYDTIAIQNGQAVLQGTDKTILTQRAQFLRPDSVLMVALLSDENDCSVRDGGQYFYALQRYKPGTTSPYHLPKPRAACAVNPSDPCCRSCGQAPGAGCDTSKDNCTVNGQIVTVAPEDDSLNLRCYDQKRRFGIDFLQPLDRYPTGLLAKQVPDRFGNMVVNPLYAGGRTNDMVYHLAIVGVPWQDIARRNAGKPDLALGLMSAAELAKEWPTILGEIDPYVAPKDPLMIESIAPRSGKNPVTGDAIAAPNAGYLANPINGHERANASKQDLQYACIFPLPAPRNCAVAGPGQPCECQDIMTDNPLCQNKNGQFGTTQFFAKAYPARRQLKVVQKLGNAGALGSICAAQTTNGAAADFGFRPSFQALLRAARPGLAK
jgi:hypothetical protein